MEFMLKTLASIWTVGSLYIKLVFRSQFVNGDSNKKPFGFGDDFLQTSHFVSMAVRKLMPGKQKANLQPDRLL